jgi:CubicO group peptidase (beta-lactamase class C family)
MKYITIGIMLILQVLAFTTHAQDNVHKELDYLMKKSHQRGVFNGSVAVIYQGKPFYQQQLGFTNGNKEQIISTDSTFALGSITKEFNAVAIMMLQEKGLIDLEAPLSKYGLKLPSWSQKVKIKHLLNYTSGLPRLNFSSIKVASDIDHQLQEIETLEFSPGKGYLYSNHNVLLQMKLIEKITKQPYTTFVENNIFEPLEMDKSTFDESHKNVVTAFNNNGVNDPYRPFPIAIMVHSTAEDMQKWLSALHTGKLVTPLSLEVLFDAFNRNSEAALGHGEYVNAINTKHRHQGSHNNFESLLYVNAKLDVQIVMLTNNKNFKLDQLTTAIESILQNTDYTIPKKSLYLTIRHTTYDDVDEGIKLYNHLKETALELHDFDNENALIRVGYKLLGQKQYESAIKIFKLSTREFPNNANAYDSLAEAYYLAGNLKLSLDNYHTSVKLDPNNNNAIKMMSKIQGMK